MKTIKNIILLSLLILTISCSDFLVVEPKGVISENQLVTSESVEKLTISAYAYLANDHYTVPNSLWPWGDLRSGDAYKGGDGPADISIYNAMEVFSTLLPDMSSYAPSVLGDLDNKKWQRQYVGISRVNVALRALNDISEQEFPNKTQRDGELHFLRGHYYFDLKILFKNIPWFDENASPSDIENISNAKFSDDELWENIANDFKYAVDHLPEMQTDAGRPNKYTAMAYLAKVKLYQAYKQDQSNNVISVSNEKLEEVVSLVNAIIASGSYVLEPDFGFPFLWQHENSKEIIWQIQRSKDDGTSTGNLDFSSMLNNPMSNEFGCCWFHIPSQNLANSFRTDNNGLPLFDTYNDKDLQSDDFVDPRIDHTIAMPGKPYKYEASLIYTIDWARQPGIYGAYSSIKENVSPYCSCFERLTPFMSSSKNTVLMRYSDVLLWKAEALIELGRQNEALSIINSIRTRAANSTSMLVMNVDGEWRPTSKYKVGLYTESQWTQDFARKALRYERRVELALEGQRFFDLVRWGVAKETLDSYFVVEKTKRDYLSSAQFTKNKHEYLPIPQQQINLSNGLYKQNVGYN